MDATVVGQLRVKIRGGTLEHVASGTRIEIDDEHTRLVGRAESCALRLASDSLVSGTHCEFIATERGVLVRDVGSKNGTRINDVLLTQNQHVFLTRPAKIKVGNSELDFTPTKGEEREVAGKFGPFESRSTKMGRVFDRLQQIAMLSSSSVHIAGETGTGKSFFAKKIHNASNRAHKPFVIVDCAALPQSTAAAALFGYVRGAFTGADPRGQVSPFVEADGGTIFLDEIGDLSLDVQAALLRAVDEHEIKALGQNQYRKVDIRIISATKFDLAARVNAGQFRDDLYARLTAARVELPPLRQRPEDIEPLVQQLLTEFGRPDLFGAIPDETRRWLSQKYWMGNVRQLRQVVNHIVDLAKSGSHRDVKEIVETAYALGPNDPDAVLGKASTDSSPLPVLTTHGTSLRAVHDHAGRLLLEMLHREEQGRVVDIARRAKISQDQARKLLDRYGLREIEAPRRGKAISRTALMKVYREVDGNQSEIARRLGVSRRYVRELMTNYGFAKPNLAPRPKTKKKDADA